MNNIGLEYHDKSTFSDPGVGASSRPYEAPRQGASATPGGQSSRAQSHDQERDMSFESLLEFAKSVQAKVKDVPYIVPIAIGGAAFTLGVLASSRIVRQVVLLAGGYAVRYAIKNGPRDEIFAFAKRVITDSFRASHSHAA